MRSNESREKYGNLKAPDYADARELQHYMLIFVRVKYF